VMGHQGCAGSAVGSRRKCLWIGVDSRFFSVDDNPKNRRVTEVVCEAGPRGTLRLLFKHGMFSGGPRHGWAKRSLQGTCRWDVLVRCW
jgi:hypothetical protein